MTSTTTTAPSPGTTDAAVRSGPVTHGAGFVTTSLATGRRTVLQFFRTPQLIMMGTIQGALFLFMFRYVFGGAISTRGSLSYVDWLVPGFLVTVILWTGMSAAAGVAEDSATGVYDRLRSLPIPRSGVMVGRSLADGALVGWGLLTTAMIGYLIGFRTHGSFTGVLAAFGLMLLAGYCFTWIFISIGLFAGNAQAAQGLSMLVIPFSFVSSANVPVSSMLINAVRSLMQGGTGVVGIGHTTTYWVALSLVWCGAILVVFGALATSRFAKVR